MIITAMYLFGIINHAWTFSWWYGLLAFIMDNILMPSAIVKVLNKNENKSENKDENQEEMD